MNWHAGMMVEVLLKNPDDFLKVRETLTRIGVASRTENKLYQSCHILHKQGKYFIVHFKELFMLDGRESNFSDNDEQRRNRITKLLSDWGLVEITEPENLGQLCPISQVKILPHKEKAEWQLVAKYSIGTKR
ncbi:translational repressor of early genes [Synechococcus phage S-CREM2]|nr:translational repressor of early genes [Synechococcus phage S-CREM2]